MNLWYMRSWTFFSTEIVMDLFILLETTTPIFSLRKRRGWSADVALDPAEAAEVFISSMNGGLCVVIRTLTGVEFGHHSSHFTAALTNARRILHRGKSMSKAHFVQIGFFVPNSLLQIGNAQGGQVVLLHDKSVKGVGKSLGTFGFGDVIATNHKRGRNGEFLGGQAQCFAGDFQGNTFGFKD